MDVFIAKWYTCTHPQSTKKKKLIVSRVSLEGRYAFLSNTMKLYNHHGELLEKCVVTTPEELLALLASAFKLSFPAGTVIGQVEAPFPEPL